MTAASTDGRLPDFGFQIQLARRNSTMVIGNVHLGQPFDLRSAIHGARDEAAQTYGDESLEVTLLDQFSRDITAATPVSLVLSGLNDQQLAERLVELLSAIQPYVQRAIVGSSEAKSMQLRQLVVQVEHDRRVADQTLAIEHYAD